jgi:hypothetical protein
MGVGMSESDRGSKADRELQSIGTILKALEGLEGESIQRVLDYVFSRLSLGRPSTQSKSSSQSVIHPELFGIEISSAKRQISIRDLKDDKQPESSNQMVALVAFYHAEVAPEADRKPAIGVADVEKGFKQAGFRLPRSIRMALPNAAAAGYLDPIGNGQYKLNPVGYNLVAHGLPRDFTKLAPSRRKAAKKKKVPG